MHSPMTSTSKACVASIVQLLAYAVPVAAGLACVLAPCVQAARPEWVAVTTLESLPADGIPRKVPIFIPQFDAWSRLPDEVSGCVFLRRMPAPSRVQGLRATNHAGCMVEFNAERRVIEDPCWSGRWDIDGRRLHSIPEWGDLQSVRTVVRGDIVLVNLADAIPE
jgi:hypothetical protein